MIILMIQMWKAGNTATDTNSRSKDVVVEQRPEGAQRRLAGRPYSHQLLGLRGTRGLGPQAPGVNKGRSPAMGDEAKRTSHYFSDLCVQIHKGVVLQKRGPMENGRAGP